MTIDEAEKIKTVVENKDYIVQLVNTVAKTMIEAFENLKIEDVNMFQLGYNKAVDDFAEKFLLELSKSVIWSMLVNCHKDNSFDDTADKIVNYVADEVRNTAEQIKELAGVLTNWAKPYSSQNPKPKQN